jgi:hypothetical protein
MSHRQTQIHKIHHGSNLGKATTFPLIVHFVPSHGASTQMSFCPGTPKLESNGMWHTTCTKKNQGDFRLLMVGSQIGNLAPDPSFGHNLCFKNPNGSCEPILDIYILRSFQWCKFFFSIQWVLTLVISLWRFESLLGLQLPKWKFIWECGGSFFHILLHSWEHEMWLLGSFLACTFASFCFGHKLKARVATIILCIKCQIWTSLRIPTKSLKISKTLFYGKNKIQGFIKKI